MNLTELQVQGYTIVKGAIDPSEINTATGLFRNWWEHNDISHRPIASHGIIKHWKIGHTASAWYIRTRPGVRGAFEALWGTKDLIVSFDGACYMPIGTQRRNQSWLHVDQAPNNPSFQCVQGFVALTDNSKATLGVLPGSHLDFVANTATVPASKRNKRWVKLPLEYSKVVAVEVAAGDLVLWDSRVAHMNFYDATEERLVQYVSYLPRARATRPDLEKRRKYWVAKRTTSHWAAPLEVVGVQPQTWGNPALRIDYDKVSDPADLAVWLAMENEIKKLV